MEIIRGKQSSFIDALALAERINGYEHIHMDIGTGDGRYVEQLARTESNTFVIGVDACRENLQDISRRTESNALFVIANARTLPYALYGLATHITINFPWGSLLDGLLADDEGLLSGLVTIARPRAMLDVRLNGGALAEAGWSLEEGANQVRDVLAGNGFVMRPAQAMLTNELKLFPTTWAKRIAFGRDPHGMVLRGVRKIAVPIDAENAVFEMI